jgi:predicted metalloprotease with PDZ domain
MKRFAYGMLLATCALAAPHAQAPAASRVTGTIALAVNAQETPRKLLHVRETLHVTPGELTLVYPKWIPGEHAPTGPITDVVGLRFMGGGHEVPWRRDAVDMYAFHLDVPQGADSLDATFDFLSAIGTGGFSSASSETAHLGIYSWNQLLLYPSGARTDDVMVGATMALPAGWKFATALPVVGPASAARIDFAPVSLTTLVDSPVIAGEYLRTIPIDTSNRPVEVDLVADSASSLEAPTDLVNKWKRLVQESDAMFGARHYGNYHFLLTLSDRVAHFGLEHHQSNDSRVPEKSVTSQNAALGVMAHEFVHSWNGKYRRPAGLATPDFQQPMVGELLWVYEGLTQYLGDVLAARSGIWSSRYYQERLAQVAAYMDNLPGRQWRPLVDTTISAQLLYAAPPQWSAYRRDTDFYDEGWLIWLDVDTQIRQLTSGQKSIDDFTHLFHGGENSAPMVRPYTVDDVAGALNQVAPYDWKAFLSARVNQITPHAPLDGLAKGGWHLVYTDTPNEYLTGVESESRRIDVAYSVGLRLRADDGVINDVLLGSPADKAGLGPGMQILAVNGTRFSSDALHDAIKVSKTASTALTLEVQNDDVVKTVSLDYHGGSREPHLERDAGRTDVLGQILASRARRN